MVKVFLLGQMEENIKEHGKIIECMEMGNTNGQMVDHMMVHIN